MYAGILSTSTHPPKNVGHVDKYPQLSRERERGAVTVTAKTAQEANMGGMVGGGHVGPAGISKTSVWDPLLPRPPHGVFGLWALPSSCSVWFATINRPKMDRPSHSLPSSPSPLSLNYVTLFSALLNLPLRLVFLLLFFIF